MIKFVSNWIQGIAIAVVIASIFEMVIPNGNLKRYIKVILGIFIIFSIISPFIDSKSLYRLNVSEAIENFEENTTEKDYSVEKNSTKKDLEKMYKTTFEKEIVKSIENEGFVVYKCNVKGVFDAEKENAGISEIKIVLESKKQKQYSIKKEDTKTTKKDEKNEDEKNNIKINDVEDVEKVEINIGNNEKKFYYDDKITVKDIDTLKRYISNHFEVEKSVIIISVR